MYQDSFNQPKNKSSRIAEPKKAQETTCTGGTRTRDCFVDDCDGQVRLEQQLPRNGQPDDAGSNNHDVERILGRDYRIRADASTHERFAGSGRSIQAGPSSERTDGGLGSEQARAQSESAWRWSRRDYGGRGPKTGLSSGMVRGHGGHLQEDLRAS